MNLKLYQNKIPIEKLYQLIDSIPYKLYFLNWWRWCGPFALG
jgi:hypothetical protein